MSFWAYMLHCRGGAFYVGHTDDLERRVGEHQSGLIPGFTADHLPVEHVWSQEFGTRAEAKAAEKQIKGWSRAKKLALIRGDWDRITALAKGKNGPSTSSGKTGVGERNSNPTPNPVYPELVEGLSFSLTPHPHAPPSAVKSVTVQLRQSDGALWLSYNVMPSATTACPTRSAPDRVDGLWQTTCFELFAMKHGKEGYCEFNFSPSSQWAAYRFDAYREGMRSMSLKFAPAISMVDTGDFLALTASVPDEILTDVANIALSAVIEETDGTKSYWALAHAPGKPDFHHPSCFTLTLPPPEQP